jgi:hypothetical protein
MSSSVPPMKLPGGLSHRVKLSGIIFLLVSCFSVLAQNTIYKSPRNDLTAVIIPIGMKGYGSYESRIEIYRSGRRLLRWRSFASLDHNHGEGISHAEWTSDGQFFVFNTFSSGGHQPWHFGTYFYSFRNNHFYSLDRYIGPITSDFRFEGSSTVFINRLQFDKSESGPVKVRLRNLLMNLDFRASLNKRARLRAR